jgi:basic membrane protein A
MVKETDHLNKINLLYGGNVKMKKSRLLGLGVAALAMITLAACGNSSQKSGSTGDKPKTTVALVTDTGGVDDKSFNQSAWEGLEAWGKKNGYSKGANGYDYFQSGSESDYANNLNQAAQGKFGLVFGIGFSLNQSIKEAAQNNPKINYVIIDDVISGMKNVASATFADQEGAYLAGVAAATQSKSGKIGFVGGVPGDVIGRFEAGYVAGAKSVNKDIKVTVNYANSFADAAKAKTYAHAMVADGVDVIYQAAGGSGAGVFSEAMADNKNKNADADDKVWVIGVDRDQKDEGKYKSKDGKESNFVLVSTVKGVGATVQKISEDQEEGKFPGGEHLVYGLKDKGVSLAFDNADDKVKAAVDKAEKGIIDGSIKVPEKPSK